MSNPAVCRDSASLIVVDGHLEVSAYPLVSEETMVGRHASADITLSDRGVSREHAIISYEVSLGAYTVEDLQSTNGTKVNGKRVRSATLAPGDELRIGKTTLRFESGTKASN